MGLEEHDQSLSAPLPEAQGIENSANLRGMMAVIVINVGTPHLSKIFHAPFDSGEAIEGIHEQSLRETTRRGKLMATDHTQKKGQDPEGVMGEMTARKHQPDSLSTRGEKIVGSRREFP